MRNLITAMKISVDGKFEGPQGYADWVAAAWPGTRFLRGLDDLGALKQEPGRDIYLMGGGAITAAALDAGPVDELRLIVYPVIAGGEKALFTSSAVRRGLELRKVEQLPDGRLSLIYGIGGD
jgi:dihydrofolate reductase